jgi:hypothetical protein
MGKPVRLLADPQLPLAPAIAAVHADAGKRIRALLNHAISANGLSLVMLAEETGIDEKQIGRSLRDDGGAHPPLSLVACVLAKDRLGVVVTGLAAMCGYTAERKSPDLGAENRRLREELSRLRDEVSRVLDAAP